MLLMCNHDKGALLRLPWGSKVTSEIFQTLLPPMKILWPTTSFQVKWGKHAIGMTVPKRGWLSGVSHEKTLLLRVPETTNLRGNEAEQHIFSDIFFMAVLQWDHPVDTCTPSSACCVTVPQQLEEGNWERHTLSRTWTLCLSNFKSRIYEGTIVCEISRSIRSMTVMDVSNNWQEWQTSNNNNHFYLYLCCMCTYNQPYISHLADRGCQGTM